MEEGKTWGAIIVTSWCYQNVEEHPFGCKRIHPQRGILEPKPSLIIPQLKKLMQEIEVMDEGCVLEG